MKELESVLRKHAKDCYRYSRYFKRTYKTSLSVILGWAFQWVFRILVICAVSTLFFTVAIDGLAKYSENILYLGEVFAGAIAVPAGVGIALAFMRGQYSPRDGARKFFTIFTSLASPALFLYVTKVTTFLPAGFCNWVENAEFIKDDFYYKVESILTEASDFSLAVWDKKIIVTVIWVLAGLITQYTYFDSYLEYKKSPVKPSYKDKYGIKIWNRVEESAGAVRDVLLNGNSKVMSEYNLWLRAVENGDIEAMACYEKSMTGLIGHIPEAEKARKGYSVLRRRAMFCAPSYKTIPFLYGSSEYNSVRDYKRKDLLKALEISESQRSETSDNKIIRDAREQIRNSNEEMAKMFAEINKMSLQLGNH